MNKFTIFTIILVISAVTVTVDLAARDYLAKSGQVSTLTAEVSPVISNSQEEIAVDGPTTDETPVTPAAEIETQPELPKNPVDVIPQPSTTINQEKVREAGFVGVLTEEHFDGKVYELLDITKNPVEAIGFYEIKQDGGPVASVVEIALQDEIRALQLYVLLQNKTKPYIDLSLNETNAYGDRSFYINHAKKPDEAFLTVKIGKMIYAFAYVKSYHPELKKLIQILGN